MKFILLVEGETERKALPDFIRRWFKNKLPKRVGIKPYVVDNIQDLQKKAEYFINGPKADDYICIIGLLDLYALEGSSKEGKTIEELYKSETARIAKGINPGKFRIFFAVHELEAWLVSQPAIFPGEVSRSLPSNINDPETIDFDEPPAKLLKRLYWEKLKQKYKKTIDGSALFAKLDPETAYSKCPYLSQMLDEMLELAKAALA